MNKDIKHSVMNEQEYEAVKVHVESLVACSHMSATALRNQGIEQEPGSLVLMLSMGVFLANARICGVSDDDLVMYLQTQLAHNAKPDNCRVN